MNLPFLKCNILKYNLSFFNIEHRISSKYRVKILTLQRNSEDQGNSVWIFTPILNNISFNSVINLTQ